MKKTTMVIVVAAAIFLISASCSAQTGYISTIAGNGTPGYTGDGGPATAAHIGTGYGMTTDVSGNVYFVDGVNQVIRKISTSGIITTVAGTGVAGFSGDGGAATAAMLSGPYDVAFDATGNLYIADGNNFRIRKVTPAGIISTIAGDGISGSIGDGGPASAAELWPTSLSMDAAGNLYVGEGPNQRVRKINPAGIINTFAGIGVAGSTGDGGPATAAQVAGPGIRCDHAGNVYIINNGNKIRKVDAAGIITTFAGTGVSGFSGDSGPAPGAQFSGISYISTDIFNNIYIADNGNNRIREITASGIINTIAGSGLGGCGTDGIPATLSSTRSPNAVCTDPSGQLYFIDNYCARVRKVTNAPDVVADSFSVYINKLCSGPVITITTNPASTGLSVKTYFGDGTNSTATVTGAFTEVTHNYSSPGTFSVKHVLYRGTSALDSVLYPYEYAFCNSLPLTFYYDGNGNCVKDSTSEPYISLPITTAVDSNGVTIDTISATSGTYYSAYGNPGDVYTFRVVTLPAGLQVSCSGAGTVTDTISSSVYSAPPKSVGLNCISTTPSFDIVEHSALRTGRHMQSGVITVDNNYCTPENAVVSLAFSTKYVFGSAIPAPVSVIGNVATWDIAGVSAFNLGMNNICYTLNVPGAWLIPGDTAISAILADPTTGDVDVTNNIENRYDSVKSSYDPNEMAVMPAGIITSGTQLRYTINFENTGNDTAHNIYVMDTLSDNVVTTSMRIVTATAEMRTSMLKAGGHNIVRFDFPGINLLDSTHHNQCNGALIFTIKTKTGLVGGTTIFNHAGIFFDDNPVVMTDTVVNVIGTPTLGVTTASALHVSIYPNPATDVLTINMGQDAYNALTITNEIGQVMAQCSLSAPTTKIGISTLPVGMYYVTLRGEGGTRVQKFVKM